MNTMMIKGRLDAAEQLLQLLSFKASLSVDVEPTSMVELERLGYPLLIVAWKDKGLVKIEFDENGFCHLSYMLIATEDEGVMRSVMQTYDAADDFFREWIALGEKFP